MQLTNKIIVITGGTTGIGFATAKLAIDQGARVVVTGRDPRTLAAARSELGGKGDVIAADSTRLDDLDRLFAEVRTRHGRIDLLFVNAGGGAFRPIEEADEAHYDQIMDLNAKSAFFTIQKALPLLGRGSSVVLNASIVASKGFPGTAVYSLAKAAVRQIARSFGAELVTRGIRVNAISPGPIDTPIFDKVGLGDGRDGFVAQMEASNPMKRIGRPEEIARAVLFFGSDDASFITGVDLPIDGGVSSF